MTAGKRAALICAVIAVVAIGTELAYLHHERNKPMNLPQPAERGPTNPDYLVFLQQKRQHSPADVKELIGQTLWVSAASQVDYYPSNGRHAEYNKRAGTLLGAEPIVVKGVFEQVAPKGLPLRIARGDAQELLAFTMPKSADPSTLYAVPVGDREGHDYSFKIDDIFFYDDPHVLYKHWGPKVWQTIDAHQVAIGMSERQVQLSLGQVAQSLSQDVGNRRVVYSNLGHAIAVTFVKDHVTSFRRDQGY